MSTSISPPEHQVFPAIPRSIHRKRPQFGVIQSPEILSHIPVGTSSTMVKTTMCFQMELGLQPTLHLLRVHSSCLNQVGQWMNSTFFIITLPTPIGLKQTWGRARMVPSFLRTISYRLQAQNAVEPRLMVRTAPHIGS